MTTSNTLKVLHEGRGGYLRYGGIDYLRELIGDGDFAFHFSIYAKVIGHLGWLRTLAKEQSSQWFAENSRAVAAERRELHDK